MHCIELLNVLNFWMYWTVLKCIALYWAAIALYWNVLNFIELYSTVLICALHLTVLLLYIVLHCTKLKSIDLHWTVLNCKCIELYLAVLDLYWTCIELYWNCFELFWAVWTKTDLNCFELKLYWDDLNCIWLYWTYYVLNCIELYWLVNLCIELLLYWAVLDSIELNLTVLYCIKNYIEMC